ncbi:MAG: cell division protein FtsL [Synergistetes bacterium]|nr:cell division protein FtsL [Synergistota bacterium]
MNINIKELKIYAIIILLLVFFLSGGYLYLKVKVLKEGYAFINLQKVKLRLEDENRKLMLKLSFLGSFSTVEKRARKELGMVHNPYATHVVYVHSSKGNLLAGVHKNKKLPAKGHNEGFSIINRANAFTFSNR